jgi:hypothetical protein
VLNIPDEDIVFIHKGGMSQSQANAKLDIFHGKDLEEGQERPRFLVAMTSTLSYGLTLNEAYCITLLEPDYKISTILQLFGRNNRLGGNNNRSWGFLLHTEGNELEDNIIRRHTTFLRIGSEATSIKA